MTDPWKAAVEVALAAKGWSRRRLATELGVTPGLVTKLLRRITDGGLQVSALVPRICELLKLPMPNEPEPASAERRRRVNQILDRMDADLLEGTAKYLELMLTKRS